MNTSLPPQEINALSAANHQLFMVIDKYLDTHWDMLTPEERSVLESSKWQLFNIASDLNAQAATLQLKLLEADLKTLQKCTQVMLITAEKIQHVKKAIEIATKAVTLASEVFLAASSGNSTFLTDAANKLLEALNLQ